MKKLLFAPLLLIIMSCAAQTVAPTVVPDFTKIHNDTLVTCVSKLDHSTLEYLKSQRSDQASQYFLDFTISNVTDVYGKHLVINQTEWDDYTCTSKLLP